MSKRHILLLLASIHTTVLAQEETTLPSQLPETVVEAIKPEPKTPLTPVEPSPPTIALPSSESFLEPPSTSSESIADSRGVGQNSAANSNDASNRPSDLLMPRQSTRNNAPRVDSSATGAFGLNAPVGRGQNLLGQTASASQGSFGREDIERRPLSRSGEILEFTPGLIATQHSGSGKANQYFVRGFNLDHGTDLAVRADGIPINLPSHGHGQGYLDINWLIPELVDRVDYKLGPYYADVGDFSSAGALDLHYLQSMPHGIASVTAGAFDYYRTLIADSRPLGQGDLLYAFETTFYDGPWDVPEDLSKLNGVLRWSTGDSGEGMTISALGYHADWTATNQISQDAIANGIVGRFGSLDPSDGGKTSRASLNLEAWRRDQDVETKANVYVVSYDLDLFSNFTYFLEDPVNGDQIEQIDNRLYTGLSLSQTYHREFIDHTIGAQFRNDNVFHLGLNRTRQRQLISTTRNDNVDQQNYAIYYSNRARLLEKLHSVGGLRGNLFRFHNRAEVNASDSGSVTDSILSPKAGLIFGPWAETELFTNWGQSFHSNDARGVTSSVDPANPLVKSEGEELGIRSWLTPTWNSSLTAWHLTLDSELVFVGDAGTTEAGPASERFGITWTNNYRISRRLTLDADYAFVRPRFENGDRIPNAVSNVLGTGAIFRNPGSPWYTSLRLRHYGLAALIEDNSARSSTTTLVNAQVGYEKPRWLAAVVFFNIFDRQDNDITYFYESQPLGLSASENLHFHPVEPMMVRGTFTAKF